MKENELYVRIEQHSLVTKETVRLEDVAKLYGLDKESVNELGGLVLAEFTGEKDDTKVFSILKVIELVHEVQPSWSVNNMGETEFVVEYKAAIRTNKVLDYGKSAIVSLVAFFGAAFTIMTFNTDVNVGEVFAQFYELVMGRTHSGGTILELSYCVGLPIGILVFYNHFSKRKIHNDPTPIQIEMRKYEEDIDKALIKNAEREGKTIDVP